MRVDLESFERWYAEQTHYHKVTGEKPGENVEASSYSIRDIADLLGCTKGNVYDILINQRIETILVNSQKRVPKAAFWEWYRQQSRYRTNEDRERDREAEEASISQAEFGRLLCLDRRETYAVIARIGKQLEFVVIADRRRITKESFERWYAGQQEYIKLTDRPATEQRKIKAALGRKKAARLIPKAVVPPDKSLYTPHEAAILLNLTEREIYGMIQLKDLPARKIGGRLWISREDINGWLAEQQAVLHEFEEE